jgi:hypothetical protein
MNKTDEYESWILEAKENFVEFIPNSSALLQKITVIVCDETNIETEAKELCVNLNVDYFNDEENRKLASGFAIHGKQVYGIIMNEWFNDIDDLFYMTLWHEIAHCYSKEHDNVSCDLEEFLYSSSEKWTKEYSDLLYGYGFWKEFEAESIAYYLLQKTNRYDDFVDEDGSCFESMMHNCIEHIDTCNQDDNLLYHYFGFVFAEIRKRVGGVLSNSTVESKMFNSILRESDADSLGEEVKDSLIDMFELLSSQMSKSHFWVTDKEFVAKLGDKRIKLMNAIDNQKKFAVK